MDWKNCLDSAIAKKITPDTELIKSLLISSSNKLESANLLKTNEVTASSKFSLAYDALREILEAVAIKEGYKIYNHECYACFLGEEFGKKDEATEFDYFRRIRNKINYYGENLSVEDISSLIKRIENLIETIKHF
jgi:hypothetical protein